jgi:hypothetical protein
MVNATDPYGRILGFLDRNRYYFTLSTLFYFAVCNCTKTQADKIMVLFDVTLCNLDRHRNFEGIYCPHLQHQSELGFALPCL